MVFRFACSEKKPHVALFFNCWYQPLSAANPHETIRSATNLIKCESGGSIHTVCASCPHRARTVQGS